MIIQITEDSGLSELELTDLRCSLCAEALADDGLVLSGDNEVKAAFCARCARECFGAKE